MTKQILTRLNVFHIIRIQCIKKLLLFTNLMKHKNGNAGYAPEKMF